MRSVYGSALCVLLIFVLVGCAGSGTPSEADAQKYYESQLGENFQSGLIKVNYFKKTNGMNQEIMGMKAYALEYEAELEYPEGLNVQCIRDDGKFAGWDCWSVETHKAGEKIKQNGNILFRLTENGWIATSNAVSQSNTQEQSTPASKASIDPNRIEAAQNNSKQSVSSTKVTNQKSANVAASKVSEGINFAGAAKLAVKETFEYKGSLPSVGNNIDANAAYGLPPGDSIVSTNVSGIAVLDSGVIQITYKSLGGETPTAGLTVLLTPRINNLKIDDWDCSGGSMPETYRPPECR